ncbi:MAG: ATP-binding protein [Oscillospiraceae bacterium]|nr:ATP-binding protein [Oscillospiraceae bacterium]
MYYLPQVKIKAMAELSRRRREAENSYLKLRRKALAQIPELVELENTIASACSDICKVIGIGEDAYRVLEEIKRKNLEAQEQARELLAKHGFPSDALRVRYTCPVCDDTGFAENGQFCECHKYLLKDLEHERLRENFPLDNFTFENFSLDFYPQESREEMAGTLETCREYAQCFHKDLPSLLFYGETGLGKTHLSGAIINKVIALGFGVEYGRAPQLFPKMTKERFDNNSRELTQHALLACDLCVLDDLGAEAANSITRELLYNLIDTRLSKSMPTIINTNLTPEELEGCYGRRIASRILYGGYETFAFLGKDIREQKTEI